MAGQDPLTLQLAKQKMEQLELEVLHLRESEGKLQAQAAEALREAKRKHIELDRVNKELKEFNGNRYGEVENLKAQIEILWREKELALVGKSTKEETAKGNATNGERTPDAADETCNEHESTHDSPLRKRGSQDARQFGDTKADRSVLLDSKSNWQGSATSSLSPLEFLDSELSRIRAEIASSPTRIIRGGSVARA